MVILKFTIKVDYKGASPFWMNGLLGVKRSFGGTMYMEFYLTPRIQIV